MIKEDLDTHPTAGNGWVAYLDANARSAKALVNRPDKFNSDHLATVDQVEKLVRKFFSRSKAFYVTHREDKLFSIVKVDGVIFPNWLKQSEKDEFAAALTALGVTSERNHKNTAAISYKILCK